MQCLVELDHISKKFDSINAIQELSLKIFQGDICSFLGAMGSGKTTLLRIMSGLMRPTSGSGLCLGYDIIKEGYKLRHELGYVTQHFSLYSDLTIYENLKLITSLYQVANPKKVINQSIELFSLEPYVYLLAGKLSGGWKKRLSLAAALIHQPKLLILDEPTAGVDPLSRIKFWDLIYEYAQNNTVIVSTHYMDEAERCNKIFYLDQGHLRYSGSPQKLIKQLQIQTYIIWNIDIEETRKKLLLQDCTEQVLRFGDTLHWCVNKTKTDQSDHYLLKQDFKNYQIIPTSLEESFILLKQKENYAE